MDLARTAVVDGPTAEQELRYRAVRTALEAVEDGNPTRHPHPGICGA